MNTLIAKGHLNLTALADGLATNRANRRMREVRVDRNHQAGQGVLEYLGIVILIAVLLAVAITFFSQGENGKIFQTMVTDVFNKAKSAVESGTSPVGGGGKQP